MNADGFVVGLMQMDVSLNMPWLCVGMLVAGKEELDTAAYQVPVGKVVRWNVPVIDAGAANDG